MIFGVESNEKYQNTKLFFKSVIIYLPSPISVYLIIYLRAKVSWQFVILYILCFGMLKPRLTEHKLILILYIIFFTLQK